MSSHHHNHTSPETKISGHHGGGDTAKEFLRRFYQVTFLLVPLFLLTPASLRILGTPDFPARPYLQFLIATIIFFIGSVFFVHAFHEIRSRRLGMMTLVSLAVGSGYLFSVASTFIPALEMEFYLEISTLIWVLLFGHYLESRSSTVAGSALDEVARLLPQVAHRLIMESTEDVAVAELKEGDEVLIKPGERVPADGEVVKGKASVDESVVTGESKPIEKKDGSQVIAGSIVADGTLTVRITKVGEHSTIGQIQKLIAHAQETKPRTQLLADRAASILTVTALLVALATLLVWSVIIGESFVFALTLAITVLVIACPHALGLAIPTVTAITTALAARNGLFIKDMGKFEGIKDVTVVLMDKTGTLTEGKFGVVEVVASDKLSQDELLGLAASLETQSSHPLARSVVQAALNRKLELLPVEDFRNQAGLGITGSIRGEEFAVGNQLLMAKLGVWEDLGLEGKGGTVVYVADGKKVLGSIILADRIKPDSAKAVADIHKLGLRVVMLTGDNEEVAASVATELGIDTYHSNVLPEDKYAIVRDLQEKGEVVMMVGDGVNDAPALTQADIGVAIGAGTDVAVESGDVILTRSNPQDIVRLRVLGVRSYRKMVENLFWALGYNIVAIPAAAGAFASLGFFLSPGVGAMLMSLSSVIVVVNALRLRRVNLSVSR